MIFQKLWNVGLNEIYKAANKFCFSIRHKNNCDGCLLKNCVPCPLSKLDE